MKVEAPLSIRVLSKNIRYATSRPSQGEKPWADRLSYLVNELRFSTSHCAESFICLQEALHHQVTDIIADLNRSDHWAYIGVGRDDGRNAGEFSPILYRPSVWKLEHFETLWLSETPWKPSKGWDAACSRILTVGKFLHRGTGRRILTLCTHLDHIGHHARQNGARIILEQVERHSSLDSGHVLPTFLAGDFNSEPNQEAYQYITSSKSPMRDLENLVTTAQHYGDTNTFTGFSPLTRRKRIDFLFINRNNTSANWQPKGYAVLPNRFEDGIYNSDHQAVVGDLELA